MSAANPLTIVIVTYNSRHEIDACLSTLMVDLDRRPAEIVVVDNASTDGTAGHVAAGWPQVKLLPQAGNAGFAAANNAGIAATEGDAVMLLNPDTVIKPGATATLCRALAQRPEAAVVGPRLLNPDGTLQPSCRDFPSVMGDFIGMSELYRIDWLRRRLARRLALLGDHEHGRYTDWLSGACLLVRRAAIQEVGLLDEAFFMYSEEMEWQYRMAQYGWRIWFEPAAEIIHTGGASTSALPGPRVVWQYESMFRFYRLYRSRVERLLLRLAVWTATWPKLLFLGLASYRNSRHRELRRAFWQILWLK
jgi:N-acetylglucosaminyl-diphospho-decaprenol L-rhamnosyltransferase